MKSCYLPRRKFLLGTACLAIAFGENASAAIIVGGWDASISTGLAFTGTGTTASANSSYVSASTSGGALAMTFNGTTGLVQAASTALATEVTFRIDLTGTQTIRFDQFWIHMQRGGTGTSNTVGSTASYSTNGTTFTGGLSVSEVASGSNSSPTGDYASITSFRTPDGFGGAISPQQIYRISGLNAVGDLSSGSLWIRYTVGVTNSASSLTLITDRVDLNNSAMAQAAANTTNGGADDGFDVIWTGTIVPEPSSSLLGGLGTLLLLRRRRA